MFVGHYAAAFALKGKEKSLSLGALFIAVQFVDILFFPFALLGLEKLHFKENFTQVNDFVMDYYPFTHGLLGSLFWAFLFYLLYYFVFTKSKSNRKQVAFYMALAVLSHWFLDLLVHTPDLPIVKGEPKFGFGLWNNKLATFLLEAVLLLVSLYYYLKKTKPVKKGGDFVPIVFVVFLIVLNYLNLYVLPKNDDLVSLTVSALFFYFLLALLAFFVDKFRV